MKKMRGEIKDQQLVQCVSLHVTDKSVSESETIKSVSPVTADEGSL